MNSQSVILQAGGRPQIPSLPKAFTNLKLILRLTSGEHVFKQGCTITSGTESYLKGHHLLYLDQQWRTLSNTIINPLPTLSMHPQQLRRSLIIFFKEKNSCACDFLCHWNTHSTFSQVPGEGGRIWPVKTYGSLIFTHHTPENSKFIST